MIQTYPLPHAMPRGHAQRSGARRGPARPLPSFWNDRQAVRLKVLLILACLIAAAALEVPW